MLLFIAMETLTEVGVGGPSKKKKEKELVSESPQNKRYTQQIFDKSNG